jgi:hypothetical protein
MLWNNTREKTCLCENILNKKNENDTACTLMRLAIQGLKSNS